MVKKKYVEFEFRRGQVPLSEGLRLPKKLDLWRTVPTKKCCRIGSYMHFFNTRLKFVIGGVLVVV